MHRPVRWDRAGRPSAVLIVIAVAGAVLFVQSPPALGDPRDDKRRVDAEVARAGALLEAASGRAQAAAHQLAAVSQALPAAQERVGQARGRVAAANAAARAARREMLAAGVDLAIADEALEQARSRVDG